MLALAGCAQAAAPTATSSETLKTSAPSPSLAPAPSATPQTSAEPVTSPEPTVEPSDEAEPTVEPTVEPIPTYPPCPGSNLIRVRRYLRSDPTCFDGQSIAILAWLGPPPIFGVLPPGIEPRWLYFPENWDWVTLWNEKPASTGCLMGSPGCIWMNFVIDPAAGLVVKGPARWVMATGHRNDPAAEQCHWTYPPDWTQERYDDADAVAICREAFVLDTLLNATAP
jgi:hypothetical protein